MAKKSEYYQADEVHRSNPDIRNPSSTTRVGVLNTQTDVSTPSFQHANCKDDSERGIKGTKTRFARFPSLHPLLPDLNPDIASSSPSSSSIAQWRALDQ
jgi:hypothetical protein